MADKYVYSGAGGAATGADWANAYLSIAAGIAGIGIGDTLWVAHDHAFAAGGATITWTFPGTPASPNRVIAVNRAGTVPPVAADMVATPTASETNTGGFGLTVLGCAYIYGITLNIGTSGAAATFFGGASHTDVYCHNCTIKSLTAGAVVWTFGSSNNSVSTRVTLDNVPLRFGAVTQSLQVQYGCDFLWKNTVAAIDLAGSVPTTLFVGSAQSSGRIICDGVDFIGMSTKVLIGAHTKSGSYYLKDCKFPASWTLVTVATGPVPEVYVIRSASGATAYTLEKYDLRGTETTETTIVRTGGASINSTPVARKLVGTASALRASPFGSTPIVATNTTVGAVNVTLYGIWTNGSLPTNAQVWLELSYLGSALTPISTTVSSAPATILTTAANLTADAVSAWGGSTTAFSITVAISPALAGEIYGQLKVATTTAVYYDPVLYLS